MDNHAYGIDLFENDGAGRLSHATPNRDRRGLPKSARSGDYLAVADYDADGRVDVLDRKEGELDLFRGVASGRFEAEPSLADVADNSNKGGVAFCDFDADGDFDAVWTDAGVSRVWLNEAGRFRTTGEPSDSSGVSLDRQDLDGVACSDVDLDGDVDLFLSAAQGASYLFLNETPPGGPLAFRHENLGIDVAGDGEAVAFADVDLDGDEDLLVNVADGPNQLWLNPTADAGGRRSLRVRALRCLPGGGFRDDLGATLRLLDADGATPLGPLREVSGGRGHGSQDSPVVHYGLPLGPDHGYVVEVAFVGLPAVQQPVLPSALGEGALLLVKSCGPGDEPPVAFDQSLSVRGDEPVEIELGGFDPEGAPLHFAILSLPTFGDLEPLDARGARWLYRPGPGPLADDALLFEVSDGETSSAPATVSLRRLPPDFERAAKSVGIGIAGDKEGGLAWCDFDGDGFLDLLVNTAWDSSKGRSRLLFNRGDGRFEDVTSSHARGLRRRLGRRSALCGDLNGDGHPDIVRNDHQRIEIYLNRGADADPPFSFGSSGQDPSQKLTWLPGGLNSEGLGLVDYDLDGDLDLVLDDHDRGIDLLANDGFGRFAHVTPDSDTLGLPPGAKSGDYLAVADYDADGWGDVLARKEHELDLWRNTGGRFAAEASLDAEALNSNKGGVAFCDLDRDGDLDAVWSDAGATRIWRNDAGSFAPTDEPAHSSGVDLAERDIDGIACGDVDLDGDLDLFLAADAGPSFLFLNHTPAAGAALSFARTNLGIDVDGDAEAVAFGDVDLDGDLDLAVNVDDDPNQLWLGRGNDSRADRYLAVRALRCVGGGRYRDDIGALVELFGPDGERAAPLMEVNGGRGHGSQDPARLHFGLRHGPDAQYRVGVRFVGETATVERLVVPGELAGYQLLEVRDTEVCQ